MRFLGFSLCQETAWETKLRHYSRFNLSKTVSSIFTAVSSEPYESIFRTWISQLRKNMKASLSGLHFVQFCSIKFGTSENENKVFFQKRENNTVVKRAFILKRLAHLIINGFSFSQSYMVDERLNWTFVFYDFPVRHSGKAGKPEDQFFWFAPRIYIRQTHFYILSSTETDMFLHNYIKEIPTRRWKLYSNRLLRHFNTILRRFFTVLNAFLKIFG